MAERIEGMKASDELNALIAERIFHRTGIGYPGPPAEPPWAHGRSRMFESEKAALAAYTEYWERIHSDRPNGIVSPEERESPLSYWEEGWGPLLVDEYSTDIEAAWLIIEHLQQSQMMISVTWGSEGGWWCVIYPKMGAPTEGPFAATAPLAICQAALLAHVTGTE